jgi:hypothetical protein
MNYLQMDKTMMDQMAREQKEKENQGEPKHVNITVAEMLARMDGICNENAQDDRK